MDEDEMLRQLNEQIQKQMDLQNRTPREEFDNLSPSDMYNILNRLFQEESPVQFAEKIPAGLLNEIPFYRLFREYLDRIATAGEMKLTARGNLPVKMVAELYGLGLIKEELLERGFYKLYKEADSVTLQNVRIMGDLTGVTKKRYNKMSLTRAGRKLMEPGREYDLFKELFKVNALKFNLGYHDGYGQHITIQQVFGYTLYLLLRYGAKKRAFTFYTKKNMEAFPQMLAEFKKTTYTSSISSFQRCYYSRFFYRFLEFYGFIEIEEQEKEILIDTEKIHIQTTESFRNVFTLDAGKFKFLKSKHGA